VLSGRRRILEEDEDGRVELGGYGGG